MFGASLRMAVVCVAVAYAAQAQADARAAGLKPRPQLSAATESAPAAPTAVTATAPVDTMRALSKAHRDGALWVANDEVGRRIELSIVPQLQEHVARVLADYQVPYGALVAIEPATGRVLAYVSHSSANPNVEDLARDSTPPAASVFKLVTASALIDAGIEPDTRVCYGGGASRLQPIDLLDNPRRDNRCATLADALGHSINTVFAKLADRHLDPTTLRRYATAFGFGLQLPFVADVTPSPIDIPSERMEFARAAAGFWHVHMSPLHAALIASTLANDGLMPRATLVDRVVETDGRVRIPTRVDAPRSVVSVTTARAVAHMMLRTVHDGTAHSAFIDSHGRPQLPGIEVAGKTGTLNALEPFRAYSWWIGFAPADKPTIALAALIVNTPNWRIKSSLLAREALREYLIVEPQAAAHLHAAQ
jgi:peptidoglycan glycosyltransferase